MVIDIFNYVCSVILKAKNGTKKILCYFFFIFERDNPTTSEHTHTQYQGQNTKRTQNTNKEILFVISFCFCSIYTFSSLLSTGRSPPLDHQLLLFSFNATVVILVIFSNSCCFFIFIPKGNSNSRCVCVLHSIFCFVVPITDQ